MIVIADTSPINYLVLIGEIEVLPKLYGRVLIPPSVLGELKRELAPEAVQRWIARPPAWLEIQAPARKPDADLINADLDDGERDAILLAQELSADELIMDDMEGRREAERRHIHFVGTLGVLRAAHRSSLLDFKSSVERLRHTNFHIAAELLDQLLQEEE
jgi:predicted nucleic acid-binding protein